MARTGKTHKRDGIDAPVPALPGAVQALPVAGRAGGARTPNVEAVDDVHSEQDLDVPGRPRIIPTPGHSPGHVAFHLPEHGVLIAGDALCTYNPLTGAKGPQLMPRAFAADSLQMQRSAGSDRAHRRQHTLFGHGEPWTEAPPAAVDHARERGLT